MKNIDEVLEQFFKPEKCIKGVISNKKIKEIEYNRVEIRPLLISGELFFQFSYIYNNKTIHKNLQAINAKSEIKTLITTNFKQGMFFTTDLDIQLLVSGKGEIKIIAKPSINKNSAQLTHNRQKNYIINDGEYCDFLHKLGVMDENGKVLKVKYDKFRQINKYLEILGTSVEKLKDKKEVINVIDFGAGKAYLTFAMYWYFVQKLNLNVNIIGLDLKKDVIDYCNQISKSLNYQNLKFCTGEIKNFIFDEKVDIVVTLHACDTATDDAIIQALKWKTGMIFLVPCCQHELFKKIENEVMRPMLKHGIIKERLSSLITDTIRGNILEIMGYSVQISEFIDMEHTPKNILIKADHTGIVNEKIKNEYNDFKKFWNIEPYLEKNLRESGLL